MVESVRDRARPALSSAMRALALSVALDGATAYLILARHRLLAGVLGVAAAGTLLVGTVAARAGRRHRERVAELIADRVFDAAVLAPIAWSWRGLSVAVSALALVSLATAYVASYQRARARGLGYRSSETVGYRVVRVALPVFGLLTGWLRPALALLAVLTVAAALVRAWNVARQERRSPIP